MSELKVNKISPRDGTAFTLGDGDTFTVPAGANIVNSGTATGFGGGAWTVIGTAVASNSASLTITGLDTSVYETFAIRCSNMVPVGDGLGMYFRLGDSGGIHSGGSDYSWIQWQGHENSPGPNAGAATSSSILIDGYTGNDTGENFSISATLSAPASGLNPHIHYEMTSHVNDHTKIVMIRGASVRLAQMNVTQIQCFMGSGNIASGRFTVWGIAHA